MPGDEDASGESGHLSLESREFLVELLAQCRRFRSPGNRTLIEMIEGALADIEQSLAVEPVDEGGTSPPTFKESGDSGDSGDEVAS
jgi:hypothetical protein